MALVSAASGRLKKISFDSRVLVFPAIALAGIVSCFAPELLMIPLGIALFIYFWNHKAQLVLFLIIYTPFEELVLKILPDNLYAPVRYMWEGLLFAMIGLMLFEKLVLARNWKKCVVDKLILLFLAAWLLSGLINNIPLTSSLAHIKNLIRYIPIFYIIYNLKPNTQFLKKVLFAIMIIGVVQAAICIGQAIEGDLLVKLFRPAEITIGGQLIRGADIQQGSYYTKFTGSFARSNELGYYLAFAACFITAAYVKMGKPRIYLLALVPVVTALILSSSRISWISAFLGIGTILLKDRHPLRIAYFVGPIILIILSFAGSSVLDSDMLLEDFNIFDRFYYMFTPEYFDIVSSAGRLYAVLYVVPAVFFTNPILGLGPGSFMYISSQMSEDEIFSQADILGLESGALHYVHDIGYVALFAQVGLIGLIALAFIFIRLYRKTSDAIIASKDPLIQAFLLGAAGSLIALAVQNLASFNFMYRNQSLLIWTIGGLIALLISSRPRTMSD
ncbi:MAG: hypothetical protein GY839_13260 [candidate division Zixibacteria bacterium]|nr:hypothetical protein [candidate division Zixibacteria bacterium]